MRKADYIIVGQGLAGTLIAHFLQKAGKSILVIDDYHKSSSTKAAAGLVNPITGRRYVKSWKIDELLPFAITTYQELEELLGTELIQQRNIIRALFNQREENDWLARGTDPSYAPYLVERAELGNFEAVVHHAFAYGEVEKALQVAIKELIVAYRKHLLDLELLLEEKFDHEAIVCEQDVQYKNINADGIIFCEGNQVKVNPYFNYLPFHGDKGQALIVKIPGANFTKSIKQKVFISPLKDDLYWIGATYEKRYSDDQPTPEGVAFLESRLKAVLKTSFEIVDHLAAVRPTVKDRRPLIGQHPHFKQLFLFNGMGTKGTSLAPFFADQFSKFLLKGHLLDEAINIQRFPVMQNIWSK